MLSVKNATMFVVLAPLYASSAILSLIASHLGINLIATVLTGMLGMIAACFVSYLFIESEKPPRVSE